MLNALYQYLVLNGNVSLPGVGNFSVKKTPAVKHEDGIHAPVSEISFSAGTAITEKQFYDFIAAKHQLSAVDAVRRFNDFCYQLKQQISAQKTVELSGIGKLFKNNSGELVFESNISTREYFPPITPVKVESPVIQTPVHVPAETPVEEETAEQTPADRWWIIAIVLAAIAIAAIGFFFLTETANQP